MAYEGAASGAKAVLTRMIAGTPAAVYAAVTDPAKLRLWLRPADFVATEVVNDLRVGGAFRFRMRRSDGEFFGAEGVYCEVVPNERVVLTWRWNEGPDDEEQARNETLLTIAVQAVGDATRVTLTHELLPNEAFVQSHSTGWSEALDALARCFPSPASGEHELSSAEACAG